MPDDGAVTHGRPLCQCHGEPMTRRNDRPSGWRCSVRHRQACRTHYSANTPGAIYARTKRRLRARIALKRARIEELEASLEAQDTC